jgi:hypothetical protein
MLAAKQQRDPPCAVELAAEFRPELDALCTRRIALMLLLGQLQARRDA